MITFESAFENIKELVEDFQNQIIFFTSGSYSEAAVRLDFIDKFFNALGWDVYHKEQKNPYLQEVKVENPQKQYLSVSQKRADYAFFLKPDFKNPLFFVEAKKPSKNLRNPDDYFQTIRYGWNAGTGISILTDFEEFHIIDCRLEPDINKVFNARHKIYHFTDYANEEKFKEIFWIFSYEAVLQGNISRYIDSLSLPKTGAKQASGASRYQSIDESFLEYIDEVREKLAKAFKKNDEDLTSEVLTEAVQKTVDRLVFIRFLEDKLIEPNNYVSDFGQKNTSWNDFISACHKLDVKYNGVVFKRHFIDTFKLNNDSERNFHNICSEFSHKRSKYDFNYIPIHILGSIYERFLGKVVVANDKRVRIEEKPEVRKAGGVYYTPKYIVNFIIQNTVGSLIDGLTPKEISKMRFADIACGSGSFLIGVLERLFDYHISYYNNNPKEAEKNKCHKIDGAYTLTIKQKQEILRNNIYGVDLDHQATEVTQLSLYLKMLEDETTATANEMQVLFHEKILPDLSQNIKCGNSLISPDLRNIGLFSEEQLKRINPLDFYAAFPKAQYFDAIIGNPPYGAELTKGERDILLNTYPFSNSDTAALFMLKATSLLGNGGKIGYIIPKAFTYASNWKKTRDFLLRDIMLIVDCSKVWNEVKLEMSIYISEKKSNHKYFDSFIRSDEKFEKVASIDKKICKEFDFLVNGVTRTEIEIAMKIKSSGKVLNDFVLNQRGGMLQQQISEVGKYGVLGGKQISRYGSIGNLKGFINEEKINDDKSYIKQGCILVQNIVAHVMNPTPHIIIIATIPVNYTNIVILDTINQLRNISKLDSKCILGILNSKLISWYTYKFVFANAIRTMHFDSTTTNKIPFPDINLKNRDQKNYHDNIVRLVSQMLDSNEKAGNRNLTAKDQSYYDNNRVSIEREINQQVGYLFGLESKQIVNIN